MFKNVLSLLSEVIKGNEEVIEELNLKKKNVGSPQMQKLSWTNIKMEHFRLSEINAAASTLGLGTLQETSQLAIDFLAVVALKFHNKKLTPIEMELQDYASTMQGQIIEMRDRLLPLAEKYKEKSDVEVVELEDEGDSVGQSKKVARKSSVQDVDPQANRVEANPSTSKDTEEDRVGQSKKVARKSSVKEVDHQAAANILECEAPIEDTAHHVKDPEDKQEVSGHEEKDLEDEQEHPQANSVEANSSTSEDAEADSVGQSKTVEKKSSVQEVDPQPRGDEAVPSTSKDTERDRVGQSKKVARKRMNVPKSKDKGKERKRIHYTHLKCPLCQKSVLHLRRHLVDIHVKKNENIPMVRIEPLVQMAKHGNEVRGGDFVMKLKEGKQKVYKRQKYALSVIKLCFISPPIYGAPINLQRKILCINHPC